MDTVGLMETETSRINKACSTGSIEFAKFRHQIPKGRPDVAIHKSIKLK